MYIYIYIYAIYFCYYVNAGLKPRILKLKFDIDNNHQTEIGEKWLINYIYGVKILLRCKVIRDTHTQHTHTQHTCTHPHLYIYTYVCVCVSE